MDKKDKAQTGKQVPYGTIKDDETYTVQEFSRRTGYKDWALRSLRKQGLPMPNVSGRSFVRGRDFSQFLERLVIHGDVPANAL
jgi:hypothetical protein